MTLRSPQHRCTRQSRVDIRLICRLAPGPADRQSGKTNAPGTNVPVLATTTRARARSTCAPRTLHVRPAHAPRARERPGHDRTAAAPATARPGQVRKARSECDSRPICSTFGPNRSGCPVPFWRIRSAENAPIPANHGSAAGERRMKYATATCHTVHIPDRRRLGHQLKPADPAVPAPPHTTHRPSEPSACCFSKTRQAAAKRAISPGAPRTAAGAFAVPTTPRKYSCTPAANSPNRTASILCPSLSTAERIELLFDTLLQEAAEPGQDHPTW
ncbi:hypothetical protein BJY18_003842 [Amycolatopsis jiangsuensis]|uniref:Uncharacterized protein n=1 Tax=Amycolatopsis jiangsuensis TaxID=1181879 RepID=A0A840IYJ4_9PSEU|nr:hypothetical protein [Amycolatopsis jiangsuensis]